MIDYYKIVRIISIVLVCLSSSWLVNSLSKRNKARSEGYPDGKRAEYADVIPTLGIIAVIVLSAYLNTADAPKNYFYDFLARFPSLEQRIPYYYRNNEEETATDIVPTVNAGPEHFTICRSIVNADETAVYNPYLDIGIKIPEGWSIYDEAEYFEAFGYELENFEPSGSKITPVSSEQLEEMVYIPDYYITDNKEYGTHFIEVFIHNMYSDPVCDAEYYKFNDNYAAANIRWLESVDYPDVKGLDKIKVGQHSYNAVYGCCKAEYFYDQRIILNRAVDEKYMVNIDYICLSESMDGIYDIGTLLFNSESEPELVESFTGAEVPTVFVPVYDHINGFVVNSDGTVITSDGGTLTFNVPENWQTSDFTQGGNDETFMILNPETESISAYIMPSEGVDLSVETTVEKYAAYFTVNAQKEKDCIYAEYIEQPFYADGYKFSAVKTVFRKTKDFNTFYFFTFPDKDQVLMLIFDVAAEKDINALWNSIMN